MKLFGQVIHEKKILKDLSNQTPSLGPYMGHALFFHKLEAASHGDALCQFWLKSMHWFLRRSHLKLNQMWPIFCPQTGPKRGVINIFYSNIGFHHKGILFIKFGLNRAKLNFRTLLRAPCWGHFWPKFNFVRKLCKAWPKDPKFQI